MDVSAEALAERLGGHRMGASRYLRLAADLASGEQLLAVVIAVWRRQGWVAVATDAGLRLARRPLIFGRPRTHRLDWEELTAVDSGPQRARLTFASQDVDLLAAGPHGEFVRLIEAARSALHGDARPTVDELRELAKRKLGPFATFGWEATIDGLPDRLEPGERVERLAGASLGFAGLLVLTDRRLLLADVTLRRAKERQWWASRSHIVGVEPTEHGLRLRLLGAAAVTLTNFVPPARREEFAVALAARVPTD